MNRHSLFIISSLLFVGSFLGSYYANLPKDGSYKLVEADQIIASGTSDTIKLSLATKLIDEVLKLEKDNPKALMIKGLSLQRRGLYDDAIKSYELLTTSAGSLNQYAHFNLAVLYQIKNNSQQAETHYRSAFRFGPGSPMYWGNLIGLHLKNNKIQLAKQDLIEALKHFPNAPEFKDLMYLLQEK